VSIDVFTRRYVRLSSHEEAGMRVEALGLPLIVMQLAMVLSR
jgi:hypothetical protein